ncbi:hypothetical protein GQ457_10G012580 [Hibiscus cannabinus]
MYGLHGGELPGSGAYLGIVKILERLASPSELETGRAPKNGRSDFGGCKSAALTGEATDGKTTTYATMLAKSGPEDVCSKRMLNFTDDEVVVLDEDCLFDEPGAFFTIIFSDHVHDQIEKSMRNVAIVRLLRKTIATTEDGAGSEQTMEAERDVKEAEEHGGTKVEAKTIARGKQAVQGNGMKFNKAYMASNPKWQSKSGKGSLNGPKAVLVVSLMEGIAAKGVSRDVRSKVGNHVAVTVTDGTHVSKVMDRACEGSSKQQVRLSRGLRIKQPLGVRSSYRVMVFDWLPGVVDMIDDKAQRMHHEEMVEQFELIRDEVVEVVDNVVVLRGFIRTHQPHVVFLLETHISGAVVDSTIREDVPWLLGEISMRSFAVRNVLRARLVFRGSFFYTSTLARRHANMIAGLCLESDEWGTDRGILLHMAVNYFQNLFSTDILSSGEYEIRGYFPMLDCSMLVDLHREVSDEEISRTVFSMSPLKALGADGFHEMFYQKN